MPHLLSNAPPRVISMHPSIYLPIFEHFVSSTLLSSYIAQIHDSSCPQVAVEYTPITSRQALYTSYARKVQCVVRMTQEHPEEGHLGPCMEEEVTLNLFIRKEDEKRISQGPEEHKRKHKALGSLNRVRHTEQTEVLNDTQASRKGEKEEGRETDETHHKGPSLCAFVVYPEDERGHHPCGLNK